MLQLYISIFLFILSFIFIFQAIKQIKSVHQINEKVDKINQQKETQLEKLSLDLKNKIEDLENLRRTKKEIEQKYKYENEKNEEHISHLKYTIREKQQELDNIQFNIVKVNESQKQLSQQAFENYCEILIKNYDEKENEYQDNIKKLEDKYSSLNLQLVQQLNETRKENEEYLKLNKKKIEEEIAEAQRTLDEIKATRTAALKAQLREQEIKENNDNFRLKLSEVNLKDIKLLKSIQPQITNAIVIDKIIQSNYYQPLAKICFPRIIGKATTCGIYKLTDLNTGLAYIGQSNDICDRQKQHCKNALGVGNITTENKLYKSMRESGLSNFTFEVIEECEPKLLDEKEKYYIELYDTYNFGLNGNRGNN